MGLIFLDISWFVYIPFVDMVKFQSFAQFTANHLSYPVLYSCIIIIIIIRTKTTIGLVTWIEWFVGILKSQNILGILYSKMDSYLSMYQKSI